MNNPVSPTRARYSSDVKITLKIGEEQLDLQSFSPHRAVLRETGFESRSTLARIVIQIDDRIDEFEVELPEGISRNDKRFPVRQLAEVASHT